MKKIFALLFALCLLMPATAQLPGPAPGGGGVTSDDLTAELATKVSTPSFVHLNAGNAKGAVNTNLVIYATVATSGSAFTISHSATLGTSIRVLTTGRYIVSYSGRQTGAASAYLVQKTSVTNSPATADLRALSSADATTPHFSGAAVVNATANDYLYMFYGGTPSTTGQGDWNNQLTILGPF